METLTNSPVTCPVADVAENVDVIPAFQKVVIPSIISSVFIAHIEPEIVKDEWTSVGSTVKKFKQNQMQAPAVMKSFNDTDLELKSIALGLSDGPSKKKKKKKKKATRTSGEGIAI